MECSMKDFPFTGQFFDPPQPPANVPNKINEEALMTLPFIGLLVGVDGHVPTHAVYTIYDSSVAGLRFVRGDGELVVPEQVYFTKAVKDGLQNPSCSQQIVEEVRQRATRHHQLLESGKHPYSAQAETQFPTLSSVKTALTYISELHSAHCTALQGLPTSILSQPNKGDSVPCISVTSNPKWNFDPDGFVAFPTKDYAADFEAKYVEFVQKYGCQLHPINFQHAAFCLVGLETAGLISFVQEGQNDHRYFILPQTRSLLPKRRLPWHVSKDWTVDCFLARFGKFEGTFGGDNYAQYPNPILWLEAEMEYEERLNRRKYPWKQQFKAEAIEESGVVVDWAFLKNVKWQTRGEFNQYPKPSATKSFQPLKMDFISEKTVKFEGSKNVRRERKEKEKVSSGAAKLRSYPDLFDLTRDESPVDGHMNQYVSRKSCNKEFLADGYLGDESEVATPPSRKKRRRDPGSRVNMWQQPRSYKGSRFQELMSRYEVKKEVREMSSCIIDNEGDPCGTLDRETSRQKDFTRKRPYCGSELPDAKTFKPPPPFSPLTTQHKRHLKPKQPIRPISTSARPKARHLSLHYGGLSKLPETVTRVSDSDDSSDFPEVEDTISQSNYSSLLSSRPLQPAESKMNNFTKRPSTISEACDNFEKKFMLDRSDLGFSERILSPSPEAECYPSIEHSIHRQKDLFDDYSDLGFSGGTNRPPSGQAE